MNCRHCDNELKLTLIDLGSAPPSNAYILAEMLHAPEKWYPLKVLVCESCWLVQTEDFTQADDLFNADYSYFSSFSTSWLEHSECYVEDMVRRFGLNGQSHVVEVAANDGYLLQYVQGHNIPCIGIEPTNKTATAARSKDIEIVEEFFSVQLAHVNQSVIELDNGDLVIGGFGFREGNSGGPISLLRLDPSNINASGLTIE